MIEKELLVNNPTGINARPATLIVKTASSFKSNVELEFNGKRANVKSLLNVLSLGIVKGSKIKLLVSGEDENQAIEKITNIIENLDS